MKFENDASVVWMHVWAVGIENAHYTGINRMLAAIVEEQRFSRALSFVITGADANWIYIAPIAFRLR